MYLEGVLEAAPDAIVTLDANHKVVEWNPGAEKLFGYTAEEATGKELDELVTGLDILGEATRFTHLVLSGKRVGPLESVRYRKDGSPVNVILAGSPIFVEDELIGTVAVYTNITERKQTVAALQQRTAQLESLREVELRLLKAEQRQRQQAETLREAALALTSALHRDEVIERILAQLQKVVPYDSSTVQLLKGNRLEIVGGRGFPNLPDLLGIDFIIGGENPNTAVVESQTTITIGDVSTQYGDFKKEPHAQAGIHSWLGAPMLIGAQLIGMIALDKKEAEFYTQEHARLAEAFAAQAAIAIENARLYEQARQDAETKTTLLHEINHRVKNNLSAIIGLLYAEQRYIMRKHIQQDDPATLQDVMQNLINRIRGMARVHAMLSDVAWAPLPLDNLSQQIIHAALQMLPPDKRISVDVHSASPVQVSPKQANELALIINELTVNTIKHALIERNAGHIKVRITRDGKDACDDTIYFEFQDDGPGYPEDVLHLKSHNAGLYLLKTLVKRGLRGELELSNECGATTGIRFKLL